MRLYRASDDAYVDIPTSFSARLEDALVYLDNYPFGGKYLWGADVPIDADSPNVLNLYDSSTPMEDLMSLAGWDPGAVTPDVWVSMPGGPSYLLHEMGYDWVRVADTFPEDAETWTFIGYSGEEPDLYPLTLPLEN